MAALVTVMFVGNVTVGTAFYQRLPENRHPRGYPWQVQPDVVTAAKWSRDHPGARVRFGASKIDSYALATYGEADPAPMQKVWPVFFATSMTRSAVSAMRSLHFHYVLVDRRMTRGVPASPGYYFSQQEPGAGRKEISDGSCSPLHGDAARQRRSPA